MTVPTSGFPTHRELTAHQEARVVVRFRNTGLLQQFQRRAARTNKDKLCLDDVSASLFFRSATVTLQLLSALRLKTTRTSGAELQIEVLFFFREATS